LAAQKPTLAKRKPSWKRQAELEKASEAQLSHMEGGKAAKTALKKKLKLESK
jgi:hypothetical protein